MPPSLLMQSLEQVWKLLRPFEDRFAIAGGLAVSYWGFARSTQDIDIAIAIQDSTSFDAFLRSNGMFPAKARHITSLGSLQVSQWRLTLPDSYVDIDVDFLVSQSEFHGLVLDRAVTGSFQGVECPVRILSCEDLILFKAVAGRMIDLADIEELIHLHRDRLDRDYLTLWAAKLGVTLNKFS